MDKALAQRLIGAIVLVMLGVLFLPMLLDGAGQLPAQSVTSAESPQDQFEYRTIQIDSTLQSLRQPAAAPQNQAAAVSTNTTANTTNNRVAAATAQPAPTNTPAAAPPQPAPRQVQSQPQDQAWAVQAGTFSVRRNALAQRDQLKSAGFQAYVLSVTHPKVGMLYRVRVGPAPDKRMAAILQQKVHLVTQLDTQLVAEQ